MLTIKVAEYVNQLEGVGGDLLRTVPLPNRGWRHLCADSCSHGERAWRLKRPLESIFAQCGHENDLATLAQEMNREASKSAEGFTTAVILDILPDDNGEVLLRWVNAGHIPPIVVFSGKSYLLESDDRTTCKSRDLSNLPFGCDHRAMYTVESIRFVRPPDAIVTMTDGITELPSSRYGLLGLQGVATVVEHVLSNLSRDGAEPWCMVDRIRDTLKTRLGQSESKDDVALSVMSFLANREVGPSAGLRTDVSSTIALAVHAG